MKLPVLLLITMCLPLALSGCANNPYASNGTTADATGGAALGALAGAVIGNQTGSPLAGAAVGAGLGGIAGYAVGHGQNDQGQNNQPAYAAPQPCPPGYTCAPQTPPPPCPPGYSCTPQ